ncbi:phosphonate C-P lyase system protein PhnH [Sciscionella sediminilitoris]|uniref:phosphonate C-P lyase system protein PhnH n=1 Tax=Sciscionella sediminilitoris TaxID=1445613 RepID=UPI000561B456|nr:phosphonate C-P lyase system protein PhnH [Sciscionella sp. SE31]
MTAISARLHPDQAQLIFRAVLDALSEPGTVRQLPAVSPLSPALLPVLALADLSTPFHCCGEPEWTDTVHTLTSAPESGLGAARLVAAPHALSATELGELAVGTPLAPERGALAVLSVPALEGGAPLRLSGPGVPGSRRIAPGGLPENFPAARRPLTANFPAGADLLLVTPSGAMAGLARTTRIEEC